MNDVRRRPFLGFLLAFIAGFGWGSMGIAAQLMMTEGHFTPQDLTSLRVFGAGAILAVFTLLTDRKHVRVLFSDWTLIRDVAIYGLGMLGTQFSFFLSIKYAGIATAAILVMTSPLFIIGWLWLRRGKPISMLELLAFATATTGVALIVTKGDFSVLNMSLAGVFWGLAAVACGSFCTLQPVHAISKVGVACVAGWGMLFAGAAALCVYSPFDMTGVWTLETLAGYLYIIVVGTAGAFFCYLKSLSYVPPSVTSILVAFEPLTAVILSVLILGQSFNMAELLGIILVFATVFILAYQEGLKKKGVRI